MTKSTTTTTNSQLPSSDRIVKTPGVCGGKPHIQGHRIKVQHIVVWHERMGHSADQIVQDHPELTLGDVHAALAYYFDHCEAINQDILDDREFAEQLRSLTTSQLSSIRNRHGANDPIPS